jgi:hypothetical protein
MIGTLTQWLVRHRRDPAGFVRELKEPVLWVERPAPEAASDDERSLHTASGVHPGPDGGEPLLMSIRKIKDNAFQRGVTLGRTQNNDLVIDDASVSRFHAWFQQAEDGRWAVADAGSKNGTMVSLNKLAGRKLQPLEGGERLRFGSVDAWFLMPQKVIERLKRRGE